MAHDVFISYRHEDQEWASRFCQALEERGISCWAAYRDIAPGSDWPREIVKALKQSRFFVVLLSSHSVNEEQISREVRIAADELKLRMFPVRIENVQTPEKLSYFLGEIQWLDAFDGKFESAVNQLAAGIRRLADTPMQPPARSVQPTPPPTPATASQPSKSKPVLWIGIAIAAVIVIAVVVIIANRKSAPPGPPPIPAAASLTADKFLGDLSKRDFQAAWQLLTPARQAQFKGGFQEWAKEQSQRTKNEPFIAKLARCEHQTNAPDVICDFNLHYLESKKTGLANVNVAQEDNGSWGVQSSKVVAPQ